MKKLIFIVASFLIIASCSMVKDMIKTETTKAVKSSTAAAIEFRSGEVLCSWSDDRMYKAAYHVATIITPASPATKNQAEVLFLDGKKAWSNYVVPSHKATKEELKIGTIVFYVWEYRSCEDADIYRQSRWWLARVTNTDDLFKNEVELGGNKCPICAIRIPEIPITE